MRVNAPGTADRRIAAKGTYVSVDRPGAGDQRKYGQKPYQKSLRKAPREQQKRIYPANARYFGVSGDGSAAPESMMSHLDTKRSDGDHKNAVISPVRIIRQSADNA